MSYNNPNQQPYVPGNKKKNLKEIWQSIGNIGKLGIIGGGIVLVLSFCICTGTIGSTLIGKVILPTPTTAPPIPTTAPPTPTLPPTPASSDSPPPGGYTDTNVVNIDKVGTRGKGIGVHFSCILDSFVKDASGNTTGANVKESSSSDTLIVITFPSNTDITQISQGDSLEVWGTDNGPTSYQDSNNNNIEETNVQADKITDQTAGYSTSS